MARDSWLLAVGHDVRQVPPVHTKPFRQTHKNEFRDAHTIAEAVHGKRRHPPRSASWILGDGKRSRRRVRNLVTRMAFEGLSEDRMCADIHDGREQSTLALSTTRQESTRKLPSTAMRQSAESCHI